MQINVMAKLNLQQTLLYNYQLAQKKLFKIDLLHSNNVFRSITISIHLDKTYSDLS